MVYVLWLVRAVIHSLRSAGILPGYRLEVFVANRLGDGIRLDSCVVRWFWFRSSAVSAGEWYTELDMHHLARAAQICAADWFYGASPCLDVVDELCPFGYGIDIDDECNEILVECDLELVA